MSARSPLTLLLPGALPRTSLAPELARQLASATSPAPTLLSWFQHATAATEDFDPESAACSAREFWWLQRAGFHPEGLKLGTGLASLLAPVSLQSKQPVWIAELAHIQVGRDGLVLTDPSRLALDDTESEALLASVQPLFEADGFHVQPVSARHWRIDLPAGVTPYAATPEVVSGAALDYWWPRSTEARPWRRLSNEIQMSWHDHPVNTARASSGQAPVNGLWLHGGSPAWQATWPEGRPASLTAPSWVQALAQRSGIPTAPLTAPPLPGAIIERDDLIVSEREENWAIWLDTLKYLENECFKPIDQALRQGVISSLELVLPASNRLVTLRLAKRSAWLRYLPQPKHDWKNWWLSPEY